jgi:large subunit ribosomal protein L29
LELNELRQLAVEDLKLKAREAREVVFRLKLKLRTNQLDNPASYRRARKDLARLLTIMHEKSTAVTGSAPANA